MDGTIEIPWRDIGNYEFDRHSIELFTATLREAADRLEFEMKDLIHEHIQETNRVKGDIVPKADQFGRPVFYDSGKPKTVRLIIRYEIRCHRHRAASGGITFPTVYWVRRKGTAVKISKGANAGKRIVPADRVATGDGGDTFSIGLFRGANPVERDLIEKTEGKATALRIRARFYSDLWARVRAYKSTKHYRGYLTSSPV